MLFAEPRCSVSNLSLAASERLRSEARGLSVTDTLSAARDALAVSGTALDGGSTAASRDDASRDDAQRAGHADDVGDDVADDINEFGVRPIDSNDIMLHVNTDRRDMSESSISP